MELKKFEKKFHETSKKKFKIFSREAIKEEISQTFSLRAEVNKSFARIRRLFDVSFFPLKFSLKIQEMKIEIRW
jgi:hypothetical protein